MSLRTPMLHRGEAIPFMARLLAMTTTNMVDVNLVKKLRDETQSPVMECMRALDQSKGDINKAKALLSKWGVERAAKKEDRKTEQGIVEAYIHSNGKVGAIVSLVCETDFVARNEEFKKLAHELAMQIAAMAPKDINDLMKQPYIRDQKLTVETLIKQAIGKLGENIRIRAFTRHELG